jgi:hypothetical protein
MNAPVFCFKIERLNIGLVKGKMYQEFDVVGYMN